MQILPSPFAKFKKQQRGFTLIELLVAISIMAVIATMSWRGLDGMVRAQSQTQAYADALLTLQVGLAQWGVDLDEIAEIPYTEALDWDGRTLRITRYSALKTPSSLQVVAWTRRNTETGGMWLRWQSPAISSRTEWQDAWQRAAIWSQNAGDSEKSFEIAVMPLQEWHIFYYRENAWSNPHSASERKASNASFMGAINSVPEGIRLVLNVPAGASVQGQITRDWIRPTVTNKKS